MMILRFLLVCYRMIHSIDCCNANAEIRTRKDNEPNVIHYSELNACRIIEQSVSLDIVNYIESFREIQRDTRWPLPYSLPSSIISTFGQVVDGNDVNRGIDVAGFEEDPVNAVHDGVLHRISGDEMIIEHEHGTMRWY